MLALRVVLVAVAVALTALISGSAAAPLQVHLVPHSHDDPGWLKTADQYYSGANSTIYLAAVQYIFDSVIDELQKRDDRTYTLCEMSFFARWWNEQSDEMKKVVKNLVKSKRLAVANGGWVMHDEAASHYVSMIDQTTLGHEFLLKELGYLPKVGWQLDPFGHSNTHAWLSSEVGFDSLFFGRIDYQDHDKRMAEKRMEMVWKGSESQSNAAVFTGAFTSGNYGAPSGLCLDRSCVYCRDDPVENDSLLETYNLPAKVELMVNAIEFEKQHSEGSHVMIKMGADFTYENARSWYKSMDDLISTINEKHGDAYHLFLSTPDKYTDARAKEALSWTVKKDDFFPYADCAHCYWSGYFSSRPTLKYLERISSGLLQILRQVILSSPSSTEKDKGEIALTAAVGLVNHHDAITGTSKQHVADDYTKILDKALTNAEAMLVQQVKISSQSGAAPAFTVCRAASNESSCAVTEALTAGQSASLLAYNPLPRVESQAVEVFLSQQYASVQAVAPDGSLSPVQASIYPTYRAPNTPTSAAKFTLVFTADSVKALSSRQFIVTAYSSADSSTAQAVAQIATPRASSSSFEVSTPQLSVSFDGAGRLSGVTRKDPSGKRPPVSTNIKQDLGYYVSFGSPGVKGFKHPPVDPRDPHLKNIKPSHRNAIADESTQASGAYLFRPQLPNAPPISTAQPDVQVEVIETSIVTEVRQTFSPWASQVVRMWQGSPAVELQWTIGPIPIGDDLGKEVVSSFRSDIQSGPVGENEFWSDSNGREFMKRVLNYRPTWDLEVHEPIAGNYYPITTGIFLRDQHAQLSVLSDRAQAATSLQPGQLELMVHRRLLADDERGVGEALNETTGGMSPYPTWTRSGDGITVSGKHWLLLSDLSDDPGAGNRDVRFSMDRVFSPLQLLFQKPPAAAATPSSPTTADVFSLGTGLGYDLPKNVQLMTLKRLPGTASTLFFRLAHQFAVGEDAELSKPVEVDLARLLQPFAPVAKTLQELNLSGNQLRSEMVKNKVQWKTADNPSLSTKDKSTFEPVDTADLKVTLTPMEVRTFTVEIQM